MQLFLRLKYQFLEWCNIMSILLKKTGESCTGFMEKSYKTASIRDFFHISHETLLCTCMVNLFFTGILL